LCGMFNVSTINSSVPDYMIRSSFAELGPAVGNSSHFIARPGEQESGADWRAVELHAPKSSDFTAYFFAS